MALIEEVLNDEPTNSLEELEAEGTEEQVQEPEDDLPEKYRGKTAKEIALMHQEAEKLIGKQGSEVGELRKVVDDFIKTQSLKEAKQEEPQLDEDVFFTNPNEAVKRAIDNHPSVKEAKQASLALRQQEVLNKLATKHPNFMDTVQDPSFEEWIKSSRVRTELFARAETQFDFDAADELLTTWKERQNVAKQVAETSKLDKQQQLKAANVSTQGSTEQVSKKKYRRADIIELMRTNPRKYEAMADEIMAAYAEGRVV